MATENSQSSHPLGFFSVVTEDEKRVHDHLGIMPVCSTVEGKKEISNGEKRNKGGKSLGIDTRSTGREVSSFLREYGVPDRKMKYHYGALRMS